MPQTENLRRAALVTGGAKGIGRAICRALAENGMNIAVNYAGSAAAAEETAAACRALGVRAVTLQADVRRPENCQKLVEDTAADCGGSDHPAKLGVMLAYDLCRTYGGKMYTVNPTNVDELCDYARPTGIAGLYRRAQTHVLNQKGIAAIHARKLGKRYEDLNLVVCHVDGGITVTAHSHGRMIDSTEGAGGDGPFTPTRLGSIPVMEVLQYLDEGHTTAEMRAMLSRSGGFVSHFGTSDASKVHALVEAGDPKATTIWNTVIYQLCKSIGGMAAVLEGKVDGILLTGGLMRYDDILQGVEQRCGWIAPVSVYPGECEQEAMADAVLAVLRGEAKANTYTGKPVFSGFPWEREA